MVQNLRIVGPKTLTDADSNVSSDFSLTASDNDAWCQENNSACDNKSMVLDSGNTTYGTYYNWYAATAGTGRYETTSGTAASSICPKGWHLPTGGPSSEFETLYYSYNGSYTAMRNDNGPAFVLSGARQGGSTIHQDYHGAYLSSVAVDANLAYGLEIGSDPGGVSPYYDPVKWAGYTIRCIAN